MTTAATTDAKTRPLFRENMSFDKFRILMDEEMARCNSVVDIMCNPAASFEVVSYYARFIGRHCDADLRMRPQPRHRDPYSHVAEVVAANLGSNTLGIGLRRLLDERELSRATALAELTDEENRYGVEGLDERQRTILRVLRVAAENALRSDDIFVVFFGSGVVIEPDIAEATRTIQALFFSVLVHSKTLREIVSCREHGYRLNGHTRHGPPNVMHRFFEALTRLTERYTEHELTDDEYVWNVRALSRTGMTLFDIAQ